MQNPNLFLAFGAGVLSFLSPCCLPIFPSFLSYVTGVSLDELSAGTRTARMRVLQHSLAFFLGFSIIYVSMGFITSAIGTAFFEGRSWIPKVGGLWVIVMGLALLGVLRIPFLMREHRLSFADKPQGFLGSVLVGITFAAGWTPCSGPILGAVLGLAANSPGYGGILLLAYCIGFAVPFTALAYGLGSVRILSRYSLAMERIGGGVMVAMGLLLVTGYMNLFSGWLAQLTGFNGF